MPSIRCKLSFYDLAQGGYREESQTRYFLVLVVYKTNLGYFSHGSELSVVDFGVFLKTLPNQPIIWSMTFLY